MCRSAFLCIRSYSSSVQRIVIVRLRFLIVSRSFLCAIFERGFGVLPDQQAFGGLPNAMLAFHTFVTDTALSAVLFSLCQFRHTRSTMRHNRFHCHRWDNYPIWTAAAKMGAFVRLYTVTLICKCRHPHFYRHPPQTKVNRRFQRLGCRYGQFFTPPPFLLSLPSPCYWRKGKVGAVSFLQSEFYSPFRSTVPFIPPCVTREKYFTTRCAKPLQAIAAHLTAVYRSCAGYLIIKFPLWEMYSNIHA